MRKFNEMVFSLLGLVALSFATTSTSLADEGVIIYRAGSRGQASRFDAAERAAKSKYSYTQRAYQGTHIYYAEGTNRDPNVYSSRVVSFYVTFDNPTVIHAGHGLDDPDAGKRDAIKIFPRRRH